VVHQARQRSKRGSKLRGGRVACRGNREERHRSSKGLGAHELLVDTREKIAVLLEESFVASRATVVHDDDDVAESHFRTVIQGRVRDERSANLRPVRRPEIFDDHATRRSRGEGSVRARETRVGDYDRGGRLAPHDDSNVFVKRNGLDTGAAVNHQRRLVGRDVGSRRGVRHLWVIPSEPLASGNRRAHRVTERPTVLCAASALEARTRSRP